MKLSALYKLCKKYKTPWIVVDAEAERQWIQVAGNIYPVDGLPMLDKEKMLTMMDVPKDEWEDWNIKVHPISEHLRNFTADNLPNDTQAERLRADVVINGDMLTPVYTDCGLILIPTDALKPVSDSAKTYTLHARSVSGETWVVVKNGFELITTIRRMKVTDDGAADCLRMVADRILMDFNAMKELEAKRNGVQQHI